MGAFGAALGDLGVGLGACGCALGASGAAFGACGCAFGVIGSASGSSCTKFPIGAMPNSLPPLVALSLPVRSIISSMVRGTGFSGAFASGSAFWLYLRLGHYAFLLGLHGIIFFPGVAHEVDEIAVGVVDEVVEVAECSAHKAVEVTEAVVVCGMGTLRKQSRRRYQRRRH